MVKAAEDRSRDNLAEPLDRPPARRIRGDRQVCPYPVVVVSISRENPAQMALAEDDDVIEAFSTDRTDQSLRMPILPRGPRGRRVITYALSGTRRISTLSAPPKDRSDPSLIAFARFSNRGLDGHSSSRAPLPPNSVFASTQKTAAAPFDSRSRLIPVRSLLLTLPSTCPSESQIPGSLEASTCTRSPGKKYLRPSSGP